MLKGRVLKVLGCMSGTSLDGVDVAMLETDGEQIVSFGDTRYRAYDAQEQTVMRAGLGKWQGEAGVAEVSALSVAAHAEVLSDMAQADLIGYHGQTLAHDPGQRRTHQAGDGQVLADKTGLPVVWDFRSSDVELGGQGAPLAPFFHFACARWIKAQAPLAILNLGGVGNITWIDPTKPSPEADGALLAFDTGPANAPLNDLMMERRDVPYDKDGALARQGKVEEGALELFLDEGYFLKMPPKSLDRDDFSLMLDLVRELDDADAAATMTAMAAAAVMQGMQFCPSPPSQVLVTGGGRLNPVMMQMLSTSLDCPVNPIETVGLDGDMLEAQAFAYLAARVVNGLPTSCPSTTGVRAAVGGGNLSYPTKST